MKQARNIVLISAVLCLIAFAGPVGAELKGTYLYNLSDFGGTVPTSAAKISVDYVNKEIYSITGDLIRVFSANGMEIHSFGEDLNVGVVYDATVDPEGNIYVLSFSYKEDRQIVTLCNYRGDPVREIKLTNIPPEFEGSRPNRMVYRNGTLYFALESQMKVFMTDANGVFKEGIDLFPLMDIKPEKSLRGAVQKDGKPEAANRADYGIAGFYVDYDGNLLFTSPITAMAYVVTPDRQVKSFGKRGSAPGRFAVPRGMARDKAGNYLVSDILRCVVMIFDSNFVFINEFGWHGWGPGGLIGPTEIAVDDDARVYVTQLMDRGVSVYKIEGY